MVQSNSNCSVGSYARDSPRRNNGPAQQDRPPASAADEGAPAVRSGRPELVNDSSGLPHPIGMAEHSAGDANSIATSSIIEKVRQFEKRRRRQLEALHGPNAADVDDLTDMYLAAPEVIDDDSEPMPVPTAAIHEDKGDVMTSKKRLDVIEDDEDAPSYIGLLNDEVVESIEKHPPASSPGQVAQSQGPSQQSQTFLTSPPNQVLENNQNSSNNSDDHTQNQNQAPAPLLVRPTPQSMLPRPSSANDTTAPPIFEVPEARVVEDDPTAPVYPATIVSDADAPPWWKRHQKYTIFGIVFVSGVAMAIMGTLLATQGKSEIRRGNVEPTRSPIILLNPESPIYEEQDTPSDTPTAKPSTSTSSELPSALLASQGNNDGGSEMNDSGNGILRGSVGPTQSPSTLLDSNGLVDGMAESQHINWIPSISPSDKPSDNPTPQPTNYHTSSHEPSTPPSEQPSDNPTPQPTNYPTRSPFGKPTNFPTHRPTTLKPSNKPTNIPTSPALNGVATRPPIPVPGLFPRPPTARPTSPSVHNTPFPTLSAPTSPIPDGSLYYRGFEEQSSFSYYPEWTTSNDDGPELIWEITDKEAHSGMHSIKSPTLSSDQSKSQSNATLYTDPNWPSVQLHFSMLASVQIPFDNIEIIVDGQKRDSQMDLMTDFEERIIQLSPGPHTIDFVYNFNPMSLPAQNLPPYAAFPNRLGAVFIDDVFFVQI